MENNDTLEVIQRIPLEKLRPYPDHPFGVRDDDMMQQTVESIKQFGVLVPGIARPLPDGSFELIAGHRRKQASAIAGLTDMPIIVRDIDRNAATIIMVDSNLQRENILPNMHIRDYKYTAEDVDCRYCTEFRHGRCGAIKCPWLNERIEAGVISYHDAVNESFSSRSPLLRRIRLVLTFYDKSFWKDDEHFRRFQQADAILGFYKSRNTNEYYSALFLLTADHSLFLRFLDCFNRREINFDLAYLKGITPEHYALYKIAKSLYTGTAEVGVDELADPELVNTESFHLVINAMLIYRYGLSALSLKSEDGRSGSF